MNEEERVEEKREERVLVVPGESIVSGEDYLPGDWTKREGKDIVSNRYGLAEKSGRLVKIIPLSGIYMPRAGNVVIGTVTDVTFNGWIMDINAPYSGFLPLSETPRFINKEEIQSFIDIGEIVVAKVDAVKGKGVDLTIKIRGLGKKEDGMLVKVNPSKVPRIIGREGSMINLIKQETGCDIIVGQNGLVWIKGNSVDEELFAKKSIEEITRRSFVAGLTEQMEKWFKENKGK
jgi:exosome complex component RRP4